jgi:hypothetical protein
MDDLKDAFRRFRRSDRVAEQISAAHDIRRVLQHRGVASQQHAGGAAQHLPSREIPRHDGEDGSQRPEFLLRVALIDPTSVSAISSFLISSLSTSFSNSA